MISKLRRHCFSKWVNFFFLIHFINLTANFSQSPGLNSIIQYPDDPLDSVVEMILEYGFEMNDDTIPDTEVPKEERSMLDMTLSQPVNFWKMNSKVFNRKEMPFPYELESLRLIHLEVIIPPPRFKI